MATPKYELVLGNTKQTSDGVTLYQIRALRDFGSVKAGDLGGYIQSESNLSHEGNAWVHDSAKVFGNVVVSGDALVYGNAWVYGNALVFGNAQVFSNAIVFGNSQVFGDAWVFGNAGVAGDARVYGNARVSGNAHVFGNAWVFGNAEVSDDTWVYGTAHVFGNAEVYDNAKVTKTPIHTNQFKHPLTLTETHIFIGCQGHTIDYWLNNIQSIGNAHGYSEDEIAAVKKFILDNLA